MDNFVIQPNDVVSVEIPEPQPIAVVSVLGPRGLPGPAGPAGPTFATISEVITGTDGVTDSFSLTYTARLGSHQVYRNGLAELPGLGFTATTSSISFSVAPLSSDVVLVSYQVLQED